MFTRMCLYVVNFLLPSSLSLQNTTYTTLSVIYCKILSWHVAKHLLLIYISYVHIYIFMCGCLFAVYDIINGFL